MSADVQVRRVAFEYPTQALPRHFVSGEIVMSHVVAMLSAMFPDGEAFFVRSVRALGDDIADPSLRDQVKGFIGQEATHGREHRVFNDRLAEMGYPTKRVEKLVRLGLSFRERIQSKRANLAVTAALEHYTATLAETLLSSEEGRAMFDVPEVRSLFLWHALEECEHKAVAFDVYRHVGGSDLLRRVMMNITTLAFLLALGGSTTMSVLGDPTARRHPAGVWHGLVRLRRSPFVNRVVVRRIRDYNRPDFHPDDHDATELVALWRAELFGAEGSLAPRLHTA